MDQLKEVIMMGDANPKFGLPWTREGWVDWYLDLKHLVTTKGAKEEDFHWNRDEVTDDDLCRMLRLTMDIPNLEEKDRDIRFEMHIAMRIYAENIGRLMFALYADRVKKEGEEATVKRQKREREEVLNDQ